MTETTLDELDTSLAKSAAELLKRHLQIARLRAEDLETVEAIDAVKLCRLIVTAEPARIQVELLADIGGVSRTIYRGVFEEIGGLLQ